MCVPHMCVSQGQGMCVPYVCVTGPGYVCPICVCHRATTMCVMNYNEIMFTVPLDSSGQFSLVPSSSLGPEKPLISRQTLSWRAALFGERAGVRLVWLDTNDGMGGTSPSWEWSCHWHQVLNSKKLYH